MDKEAAENYIKAGEILQKVLRNARKSIKPGQKLLEIAEKIEKDIESLGNEEGVEARPAFPANLSINNNAAHYTPSAGDETELGENDVLKVDAGVHVDGYIADAAFTIDFSGEFTKMVEASEKALENAVAIVKVGAELREIGKAVQETVKGYGFNVVQNLSGHGLGKFNAHSPPTVPSIENRDTRKIEDGMAFAIEPFVTDGVGFVKEGVQSEIFQLERAVQTRNMDARKIIEFVSDNYDGLPFAERWIDKELGLSDFKRKVAMKELLIKKVIRAYPILKEEKNKTVTQSETSILVYDGEVKVLV